METKNGMRGNLIFPIIIILTGVAFNCIITALEAKADLTQNDPPKVTITTADTKFRWNELVNYTISVSDKEDGNSEYNEIAASEVLLKVVFLQDSSKVRKYLSDKVNNGSIEPPGLTLIKRSACFTCHAAKNKLIGPSYQLISNKYPNNPASIDKLVKTLVKGSKGIWGNTPMPPHPDLKNEQAKEMISWILKNNTNPDVTYFTGIQGAFRTKQKPAKDAGKGVYIITASYTDHGVKGLPQLPKSGHQTVMLRSYAGY